MKKIQNVELRCGSREEILPDFVPEFPYIASFVEMDRHTGNFVPWHWHKEIELFYILEGVLEYNTPGGKTFFPPGSAGIVNSNVLHMTRLAQGEKKMASYIHIFDPSFISGSRGNRIDCKYVTPLVTASQIEIIGAYPDHAEHAGLLEEIVCSFELKEEEFAYELKLRSRLSDIWCQLLSLAEPMPPGKGISEKMNDKAKLMLAYIHENYSEKISIREIAAAAYVSERESFRTFRECLHMTPAAYLLDYRLQNACRMLTSGEDSITQIGHACGLGSSSYFGKTFRTRFGCTPLEYRHKWRDLDKNRQ